jgi:hypothetical protein
MTLLRGSRGHIRRDHLTRFERLFLSLKGEIAVKSNFSRRKRSVIEMHDLRGPKAIRQRNGGNNVFVIAQTMCALCHGLPLIGKGILA